MSEVVTSEPWKGLLRPMAYELTFVLKILSKYYRSEDKCFFTSARNSIQSIGVLLSIGNSIICFITPVMDTGEAVDILGVLESEAFSLVSASGMVVLQFSKSFSSVCPSSTVTRSSGRERSTFLSSKTVQWESSGQNFSRLLWGKPIKTISELAFLIKRRVTLNCLMYLTQSQALHS